MSYHQGDIIDVEKNNGKTEVLVSEGFNTVSYALDEGLVEFGTAIDDGDFDRSVTYLMWGGNLTETDKTDKQADSWEDRWNERHGDRWILT